MTASSLLLSLDLQLYNQPLDQFVSSANGTRETVFGQFMEAIKRKDDTGAAKLFATAAESKGTAKGPSASEVVSMFGSFFNKLQNAIILGQAFVEDHSLFIWRGQVSDGSFVNRGFVVSDETGQKIPKVSVASNRLPVDELIIESFDNEVQPLRRSTKFAFRSQLFLKARRTDNPIWLEFKGEAVNFNVFSPQTSGGSDLLDFYRDAWMAFQRDDTELFLDHWTPKSQAKYKDFISNLKKQSRWESYRNASSSQRSVKFILDADPVFLVFYSLDSSPNWRPGTLNYDYVVRDKGRSGYRLTNFFFSYFLDGVLKDSDLFNQSVFKRP